MVSKYDGLGTYLRRQTGDRIPMTFSEIEAVTGTQLPPKAQHSRAWWSNNPTNNVMTKIWLDAGFETAQVDIPGRKLIFRRKRARGLAEDSVEFAPPEPAGEARQTRHPALGAMKGTFWIDPSWDLTQPSMSDQELAEMDDNLDRTADMINAGASGMSESARDFQEAEPEKKRGRHPLIGCMKGTFWMDPKWDWTKPALDIEELTQWEASLARKFDLYESGRGKK